MQNSPRSGYLEIKMRLTKEFDMMMSDRVAYATLNSYAIEISADMTLT